MDPLSIVAGAIRIAGAFSICIDVLERVEVYKTSNRSLTQLLLRVRAEKQKLQEWAATVGIEGDTLREHHYSKLDDERTHTLVIEILAAITDIFNTNDDLSHKLHLPNAKRKDSQTIQRQPSTKTTSKPPSILSTKAKLAWAFLHQKSFVENVEILEILTAKLCSLIPEQDGVLANSGDNNENISYALLKELRSMMEDNRKRARIEGLRFIDDLLNLPRLQDELDIHSRKKLVNTCNWIFDKPAYKRWILNDPASISTRFLWLYGSPGFGKTVLCSNIIVTLRQTHSPLVFHFFSSSHAPNGALDDIIRTWISQITRVNTSTYELVYEYMSENIVQRTLTSSDLWKAFGNIVSQIKQCIFIIDGLDEYKDVGTSRHDFLISLKQNLAQSSSAVLITSREDPEIRAQLTSNSDSIEGLELFCHNITKTDNYQDIHSFSHQVFEDKVPDAKASLRPDLASRLTDRCEGMFLLAALTSKGLRKGLSQAHLQRVLNTIPKGLNSVYARNWQKIIEQEDYEKERGLKILYWCVFSVRPLTVGELTEALITDPLEGASEIDPAELPDSIDDDYIENQIKNPCGFLVDAVSPDSTALPIMKTVQLIHLSVKEYLLSMKDQNYPDHHDRYIQFTSSYHLELAKVCLDYLCRTGRNTSQEPSTLITADSTFLEYAIENWITHKDMAGSEDLSFFNLLTRFLDFENANFHTWAARRENREISALETIPMEYGKAKPLYWASLLGIIPSMQMLNKRDAFSIDSIGGMFGTALQAACAKGHYEAAKTLLGWGADVNTQAGEFGSALGASAHYGRIELVFDLLKRGAKTFVQGKLEQTPLYSAARMGHLNIVKTLLDHGANIAVPNKFGYTALHVAADNGHLEVVRLLLQRGYAGINKPDQNGWTPLYVASRNGHLGIVQLLLEKEGTDINKPSNLGWTPLLAASSKGHVDIVRLLLERDADIHKPNSSGWTPLNSAISYGHLETVRLLLERGANPSINEPNPNGWTPLNAASCNGHLEIVRLLLERGANPSINEPNNEGWTPLNAASDKGHLDIVHLLLEKGADINKSSSDSWTPLNSASSNGHLGAVRLLLEKGANPNIKTNTGQAPIYSAVEAGHEEIVKLLLLEKDIDIEVQTQLQWTPLANASNNGRLDIVRLLLNGGANPSNSSKSYWAPLVGAVRNDYLEIARLLLDRGADPNVLMENGWSIPILAVDSGNIEIVKLLVQEGATTKGSPYLFTDPQGCTIIHHAIRRGNVSILSYLLDTGSPIPTSQDKFGRNMLDYATMSGSLEMIEKVLHLHHSNKIEIESSSSWSPLHRACQNGSFDILKLLMEAGVKSQLVNTRIPMASWSPFDLAVYWKNMSLVSTNNTMVESHSWLQTLVIQDSVGDTDSTSLDTFRSNTLLSPDKKFGGWCDGCRSDIFGPRFHCKMCYDYDFCFLCKHESGEAHDPKHEWECLEYDNEASTQDGDET